MAQYSKSKDVYTVLLRSTDGSGNNPSKTFYVNWKSVLPQDIKTFKVKGLFNAEDSADNTSDYVFVSVSSLSLRSYDSKTASKTGIVTYSEAVPGGTNNQYNTPRIGVDWQTTDYPQSLECVVQVRQLDNTLMTGVGDWFLFLHFIPIH